MRDVPTSHSVIFSMFGCTNPSLLSEYASSGGGASSVMPSSSSAIGSVSAKITNIAVNVKADHVKKMYEEAVMVRKVRHYLAQMSRLVEKNEERLRLISSTLEHSTSTSGVERGNNNASGLAGGGGGGGVHTLKRNPAAPLGHKPSPNSSLGGSVSSINAALNLSGGGGQPGINSGNGPLVTSGGGGSGNKSSNAALFGAHSPDAVKKLLALSETKVKTVKNSSSSSSVPLSQLSNSRLLLNTSASSSTSVAAAAAAAGNNPSTNTTSPSTAAVVTGGGGTHLSPKSKHRSVSSSQPINPVSTIANPASAPVINSNSNVSTIKLSQSNNSNSTINGSSTNSTSCSGNIKSHDVKTKAVGSNGQIKSSTSVGGGGGGGGGGMGVEADSGRASMASNVDQDQCSPTFQQRAFVLNRCRFNAK